MPKGGYRENGGRPYGTGKFKEGTVSIRIPLTLVPYVELLLETYIENGFKVKVFDYNINVLRTISKD